MTGPVSPTISPPREVRPWTADGRVIAFLAGSVLLILALALYCAVKMHGIAEQDSPGQDPTAPMVVSGGSDLDVTEVCKLLGAVAARQEVDVAKLFLLDTGECAVAAEAAAAGR